MTHPAKIKILTEWQRALVVQHRRLVISIAKKYCFGQIPDDIIAEGNLGLCLAAQRFDRERNTSFPTYATFWVRAMILKYIVETRGPVRIGTTRQQRRVFFGLNRAREAVGEDHAADPQALADYLNVDVETLELMAVRLSNRDVALDVPVIDGRNHELTDNTVDVETQLVEEQLAKLDRTVVRDAVARLEKRDRQIIERRFLREKPQTLQRIASHFGLSRERVRQLELRALGRLRMILRR